MTITRDLSRRHFLYGSALAAGVAALAGCQTGGSGTGGGGGAGGGGASGKGSATRPLSPPSSFSEAPMLAEQVKAGDLPAVEERLPENPYVVPHNWLETGKYGGGLLMITPATAGELGNSNREWCYGHSPLRWLNDGLDIGPGLMESWESNDDASEWTLHFRNGLKWSDGEPWTTADIMFWWEDIANNSESGQVPPDEAKSGNGTLMEMTAPDEVTIVMTFDAPAPLTADRLAMWVNGGVGDNGPIWMLPKHYLKEWHPQYSNVGKDWASAGGPFWSHADFATNPDCPTMTGWRVKTYREGRSVEWERNPYYWCVDKKGNQLPYLDTMTMTAVPDPEVGKLQIQEGKVDYAHGPFVSVLLLDVSTMKRSAKRADIDVYLWDSGSGTGSIFFLNYDHPDDKFRKLIREPTFRQALSLAFNRDEAQKSIYFNTGEQTTGTLSPKAIEYVVNAEGRSVYREWRDSYVQFDPDKAKQLLDDLGVVDKDGDGNREMPDGSKLVVRLDFMATATDEHREKNNLLKRDWGEIGIVVELNPVAPEALEPQWTAGRLTARTDWEVGDGPNHLVYPQWLVPLEPTRWAPLTGQFYNVIGTPEENKELDVEPYKRTPPRMEPEPGGPIERLWKIYDRTKVEPDEMKRHQMVWDMIKIHVEDGPFFQGTVANYPQVIIKKKDLSNVPARRNLAQGGMVNPWIHPTPAVYDPETYFWINPEEH